ncbi:MAG: DNA polymerase/3'-5' exonuclease PolX [Planctomycetes bacterium]|nr:DNA polymerase/3'-5' exonuclease PolX [Planctomycetota bacterium]
MDANRALAEQFKQMAIMLELLGHDRFRVNAHARAARAIEALTTDLATLTDDKDALTAIDGIGTKSADKIIEFCTTGEIAEYESLRHQVPAGIFDVLAIQGLGPKTVRLLWEQAGVKDLAGLKRVLNDGSILDLPRMGAKTVQNIKAALTFAQRAGERLPLGRALQIAQGLVAILSELPEADRVAYAGSLRRGRDTIGDIDLLVATNTPAPVHDAFRALRGIEQVLAAGETKSSVRVRAPRGGGRFAGKAGPVVQVDLRTVPPHSFGAALMYFTGSKEHNVRLRQRALKKQLTLNEYGLFPLDHEPGSPQSRGVQPVASKTEEQIYAALDLPLIPPQIREDRGELDLTAPPTLIELTDIKAELHAHTNASDGSLTLEQLVALAKNRGFHTIAVTDHSKSSVQANGLSVQRLREQIAAIKELNERTPGITILAGSEVDILSDGSLDYDDELLAQLDIVVASPHVALSQDAAAATRRLLAAIEHPLVHILGHPTGRLIGRRPGLAPAMNELIAAAVQHDTALEINAHWIRLDLRDTHVRAAVDARCNLAINCDVHADDDFDNLRFGVLTAQRGWLTPELCINAWNPHRLHTWLTRSRH